MIWALDGVGRPPVSRLDDLRRIERALALAEAVVRPSTPGKVEFDTKNDRGDPLTAADLALNDALRAELPERGEGWLSEETADDSGRLRLRRVWVVDPLDGTREFVDGIAEWCIAIGLVEDGVPVAGGVLNPATGERVVGAVETGVELSGAPRHVSGRTALAGARVLASRSEVKRGEWERFRNADFEVVPCGSVAYKLALVAAGLADATWTLVPKHEWDVAAGTALVRAAGGVVVHVDFSAPGFNQATPMLPNLVAGTPALLSELRERSILEAGDR